MGRFDGVEPGRAAFTSLCPLCDALIVPGDRIEPRYVRIGEGRGRFAGRHPRRHWYTHASCAHRLDQWRGAVAAIRKAR